MSETKHTPGPWCVKRRETSLVVQQRVVGRVPPKSIASVARKNAANAQLIAAAPDLLDALQLVLDVDEWHLAAVVLNKVHAAIAKAEGK